MTESGKNMRKRRKKLTKRKIKNIIFCKIFCLAIAKRWEGKKGRKWKNMKSRSKRY